MNMISLYKLNSGYTSRVYNSGRWIDGKLTRQLEEKLKEYLHVPYIVLTNSGTSALLAAYWVLKNEYRDLTVDPYTFPATYQPAKIFNYKIRFRRMIPGRNNKQTIRPAAKSLTVITHLYGQPSNYLGLLPKNGFIEDACQAFGAKFKNRFAGTIGKIGCFSFYPTKTLHTCGHAGAVVTREEKYYRQMKIFVQSGRENGIMTDSVALNLRTDEIKAEYILKELRSYDKRIAVQREIAAEYKSVIPDFQPFLEESTGNFHIYSSFCLLVKHRNKFREHMSKYGIGTLVYYNDDILPENQRHIYRDITSSIVSIPCRYNLTKPEVNKVKKALQRWYV